MMRKNKVYFYSSVKTKKMFSIQSYYRNDICILRDLGYDVYLCNSVFNYLLFWKYDIAFLYFYKYSFFAAFFAKLFRKKVFYTGGVDYLEKTFASVKERMKQILLFKMCNFLSDSSIIVSSADWENIKEIYGGKTPMNCFKSFHPIDYDRFKYEGSLADKEKIVTTIAWMVRLDNVFRKGVDKSVKIFSQFVKTHTEYRLIIAGPPGKGSDYILNLISELGLEESVIYKGAISEEEKVMLLKKSRCYLQLSQYEGFGIAAVEALAAGNMVIHSGRGGLRDALGSYGYKVDIESDQDILDTLSKVCIHDIDEAFVRDGMNYVKKRFSYETRLRDFSKIIGCLI